MKYAPINLEDKLSKFSEHYSPRIAARMNDYYFKLGKFKGEFVWRGRKHDGGPRELDLVRGL